MKHKRKQENEFTEENVEKNNENQINICFNKILELLILLEFQGKNLTLKLSNCIVLFLKYAIRLIISFMRKEGDIEKIFLLYVKMILKMVNRIVEEYVEAYDKADSSEKNKCEKEAYKITLQKDIIPKLPFLNDGLKFTLCSMWYN